MVVSFLMCSSILLSETVKMSDMFMFMKWIIWILEWKYYGQKSEILSLQKACFRWKFTEFCFESRSIFIRMCGMFDNNLCFVYMNYRDKKFRHEMWMQTELSVNATPLKHFKKVSEVKKKNLTPRLVHQQNKWRFNLLLRWHYPFSFKND